MYRNAVYQYYSRRSVDIKHSSTDEVPAGLRGTCDDRSVVAASTGSRTSVQQALDVPYHQPWPCSYPGQSTVEFWGDALKTGHVTGTLVQCPKLCQYVSQFGENNLRIFLGVIHFKPFVDEKPPDKVQFKQLLKHSGYSAVVTVLKTVTKRDGTAMIR